MADDMKLKAGKDIPFLPVKVGDLHVPRITYEDFEELCVYAMAYTEDHGAPIEEGLAEYACGAARICPDSKLLGDRGCKGCLFRQGSANVEFWTDITKRIEL
jgi:hypothetical protein